MSERLLELQRQVDRYRDMVESSLGLICTHDLDGVVLWVNAAAADLLGWDPEDLVGTNVRDLLAPSIRHEFDEYLARVRRDGEASGVMQVVARDGACRFWKYRNILRRPPGESPHVLGHSQDITEQIEASRSLAESSSSLEEAVAERTRRLRDEIAQREEAEEALRKSQRMESVGVLAGGLAHDFNNLLTTIHGYTELLGERSSLDAATRRAIGEIAKAGRRAAEVTRQLLAFSRQQVMHPRRVEINQVIRDVEAQLEKRLGDGIALRLDLDSEAGEVRVDPAQIEQVLLNLTLNARDAMPHGGELLIRTRPLEQHSRRDDRPELEPGSFALVSVSDGGVGMDDETRRRAFEPFYTTKNLADGGGLGLAMVYGIVKQSQGWVYVDSGPGRGTTFDIYLPRITPAKNQEADGSRNDAGSPSEDRIETILLVEDDLLVARLMRSVLEESGYEVLFARSADEALDNLAEVGRVSLLLSDVILPGMHGPQLAERVRERCPEIRTLFVTGYTPEEVERRGITRLDGDWLIKPFTPRQLTDRVRQILDA